jgi:CBS domain-containing protein
MITDETPLLALDGVVLDTETTGLDTRTARIVQIGAVRLANGVVCSDHFNSFEIRVNPQIPIPAEASRIHGLLDKDVENARTFDNIIRELEAFLHHDVVIGHNIRYDLKILDRQYRDINREFHHRRWLDTHLLAQLVQPECKQSSLEEIAAWLGVPLEGRHTALGDAKITAQIFVQLGPKLLEKNIRTLAQAERASRLLGEESGDTWLVDSHLYEPVWQQEEALSRIDPYIYQHRISDVMSSPPAMIDSSLALQEAMKAMVEKKVSSLLVFNHPEEKDRQGKPSEVPGNSGQKPVQNPQMLTVRPPVEQVGIVTEKDVLAHVAAEGEKALKNPVALYQSRPLVHVRETALVYRAVGRMSSSNIRHLVAIDDHDRVTGIVSARDLLRLRASEAISLGDEISHADNAATLAKLWSKVPRIVRALLAEEVDALSIAEVISREVSAMTRQAAILAEREMIALGHGEPPAPYAVLLLGSAARGESLLAPDQDNALVYTDRVEGKPVDGSWFLTMGQKMSDILNLAGIPSCKGGIMASQPGWTGSVSNWVKRIQRWVHATRPKDLLNVDLFFDMRPVYGDRALARDLLNEAYGKAQKTPEFIKLLAQNAEMKIEPFSMLGTLRTQNGGIDLKKYGLFPVVSTARILSIRYGVKEFSTKARLKGLLEEDIGHRDDLTAFGEDYALLAGFVLRQQLQDLSEGIIPSNRVEVKILSRTERDEMRKALKRILNVDIVVYDSLFA